MIFNGNKIEFDNVDQLFNMGGPWVGDLLLNSKIISNSVIIDNLFYDDSNDNLFFVRYNKISKWAIENYFIVCYINLTSEIVKEIDFKFSKVYIDKIENNKLFYFDGFHRLDDLKEMYL